MTDFSKMIGKDFYMKFNGKDSIHGTNTPWLNKEKKELESKACLKKITKKEQEKLINYNSELGLDTKGKKNQKHVGNL